MELIAELELLEIANRPARLAMQRAEASRMQQQTKTVRQPAPRRKPEEDLFKENLKDMVALMTLFGSAYLLALL